ncbi:outer membrane adhesin like protein [Halothece sp. PCC 7418]|uniref:Ig-like domain-containing protein n=1 Tax=Halothece sp. (strain PCC 7418) TaxID=65093 RepID=UPI0002A0784B|nr:Ig-like domain-containing protein [Halothece sp. PCC 7418]AFZ42797.1 outer membrane adhesin like protein [Halothece sp. PCC 7418]
MRQIITVNPIDPVAPNSDFSFDAVYTTAEPENAGTTGLVLRLHYDSSDVNVSLENVLAFGAPPTVQDQSDDNDLDNDPSTDRLINVLFLEFTGTWPGTFPATLYTVQVETLETFDGTTFNFTADPAEGFDFEASPVVVDQVAENQPPVATEDSFTTDEDTGFTTGNVLDNDTDPEDDTLSVSAIDTSNTLGTVTDNGDGTFDYDPNGEFESLNEGDTDTDSFTYTISDGNGGEDTATVTVTIEGVDEQSENQPPVATEDSFTTDEDTGFTTGNVLDNDTDPEDDTLSVSAIDTSNTLGTVTDNGDGTFDYDPNGEFESLNEGDTDTDSFTYTISDGNGGEDTATVTVTIEGVDEQSENQPPVATEDSFTTDEDTGFTTGNVLDNDTDPEDDTLSVSAIDTSNTLGTVTDNGDGTFDYDPNGEFESLNEGDTDTDSFTYTISDGNGGEDTATVTVTIEGVDDTPTATADNFTTNLDTAITTGNVLDNDSDPDGDTLTITAINGNSNEVGNEIALESGALLTLNENGSFDYNPNGQFEDLDGGETDSDSFTYTVSDGNGNSDTATVTITINAPIISNTITILQENAPQVVPVSSGFFMDYAGTQDRTRTFNIEEGAGANNLDAGATVNLTGTSSDFTYRRDGSTLQILDGNDNLTAEILASPDTTSAVNFDDGGTEVAVAGGEITFGGESFEDGEQIDGAITQLTLQETDAGISDSSANLINEPFPSSLMMAGETDLDTGNELSLI